MMNGTERRSLERSLAARLVAAGKLDNAALERVTRLQDRSNSHLQGLLVKLGLVQERDLAEALADELGLPIVGAEEFPDSPVLNGSVNEKYLRHNAVLPLRDTADTVVVAMADPLDLNAIRSVEMVTGKRVAPRIAKPSSHVFTSRTKRPVLRLTPSISMATKTCSKMSTGCATWRAKGRSFVSST